MAKRPSLNDVLLTAEVIDDILDKIGVVVMPPQSTATFLLRKMKQLRNEATSKRDPDDRPDPIQELRYDDNGYLVAADVVAVGEDEKSLIWLTENLHARAFGPKSREILRLAAKALRELYPEPKPKKVKMAQMAAKKSSKKKGGKKKVGPDPAEVTLVIHRPRGQVRDLAIEGHDNDGYIEIGIDGKRDRDLIDQLLADPARVRLRCIPDPESLSSELLDLVTPGKVVRFSPPEQRYFAETGLHTLYAAVAYAKEHKLEGNDYLQLVRAVLRPAEDLGGMPIDVFTIGSFAMIMALQPYQLNDLIMILHPHIDGLTWSPEYYQPLHDLATELLTNMSD